MPTVLLNTPTPTLRILIDVIDALIARERAAIAAHAVR
jgi:hypothetical protein